jgi:Ni,Fe-hydrogenase III small subunit
VTEVDSAAQADVVVVTGLLTLRNLDSVLAALATTPSPSVLVAAGDSVINPKGWSSLKIPGLPTHPLNHYVEVQISVPGNPPTPQALIVAIAAAAKLLSQPLQRLQPFSDQ